VVNEKEKVIVNLMFKKYLKLGSFKKVAKWLNDNGYRTYGYVSRRGVEHKPREFAYSVVQNCLENHAYIGLKEINKFNKGKKGLKEEEKYSTVKAVWEPIVPEGLFWNVQELIGSNARGKGNQTKVLKHNFLFKSIAWCGICSEDGNKIKLTCTYGKNRHGKTYYYYICKNCKKIKLGASELENLIMKRFRKMLEDDGHLEKMVKDTNQKFEKNLPLLMDQKQALERRVGEINKEADQIITSFAKAKIKDVDFVEEKLRGLEAERKEIKRSLDELELQLEEQEKEKVDANFVRENLRICDQLFKKINPDQQVSLVRFLIKEILVHKERIKIQYYGSQPPFEFVKKSKKNKGFTDPDEGLSQRLEWRAVQDSNLRPTD
jgi:site-specific DNA recombinase